jgi:hypothetical protein
VVACRYAARNGWGYALLTEQARGLRDLSRFPLPDQQRLNFDLLAAKARAAFDGVALNELKSLGLHQLVPRGSLVLAAFCVQHGSKGVDIQLAVDALSHVYKDNVEAVYIMSGDGDFLPLLEEALRQGKQVYLSAFSGGLNDRLAEIATDFYLLDNAAFV